MTDQTPAAPTPGTLARYVSPLADELGAHLREELGTVRIDGEQRDRLDLIAEQCDDDTRRAVIAWLSTGKRRSRNTRRAYADDIRAWAGFAVELGMPVLSLAALTPGHITAWRLAQDSRGTGARTVARRLSALSSLCNHAARHGYPVANPVDPEDHRPQIDRHDRSTATPVLEISDIRAMIGAASDARDVLVLTLLYTLAGRVSEMCAADAADLTDTGRRATLTVTRKGGKRRPLALPPALADLLAAYLDGRTTGPLLLDTAGARLDRHDVDRILTRLGHRAGVGGGRDVTPHVLRASRVTHMVDAGVPLAEVQAYADHADPSTTIGYVERRHADARNERLAAGGADALGDALTPWLAR